MCTFLTVEEAANYLNININDIRPTSPATIKSISKIRPLLLLVSTEYNVSIELIKGKQRSRRVVIPRHTVMWLASELTRMSLPQIGRAIGNRDHTTVINAIKNVENWIDRNMEEGRTALMLKGHVHHE